MKRTTLIEIINILLISLFLYAAISKLMDYTLFKEQLSQSPFLKHFSAQLVWMLPTIEFIIVALLIIPRFRLRGFYASLGLLIIFTVYIIIMMITSPHLPCSCGGLLEQLSWKGHIIFNIIYIAMAALGIALENRLKKGVRQMNMSLLG